MLDESVNFFEHDEFCPVISFSHFEQLLHRIASSLYKMKLDSSDKLNLLLTEIDNNVTVTPITSSFRLFSAQ